MHVELSNLGEVWQRGDPSNPGDIVFYRHSPDQSLECKIIEVATGENPKIYIALLASTDWLPSSFWVQSHTLSRICTVG